MSKLTTELPANGYTSEEIKSVLKDYYQKQGVAESELDKTVNKALTASAQTTPTTEASKNKEYAA